MKTRLVSVLAAWIVATAPAAVALAAAGDGIRLGPTLLLPVLSVDALYDSNIHLVSEDPDGGWVTTLAPSLNVVLPIRRFFLTAEGGLEFKQYSGIDQDDYTDWFVGGAVGADFPGGLSFKVDDRQTNRFLVGSQEFGVDLAATSPTSAQDYLINGEDYQVNTLNAMAAYAIRDALKVEISGTRSDLRYSVSDRRQRVETTVRGDLFWRFRPKTSAFVEGSYADYAYDTNLDQDNNALQVALGLIWDVTEKSSGTLKGGYQWKRYADADPTRGIEDGSYYTVSVGVKHAFTPRTVFNLDLLRASQESDYPRNPYFLRNTVDVSLMQRLTPKFYGRVSARYGVEDYPNEVSFVNPFDPTGTPAETGVREDTGYAWSASLGYDLTRWLSFKVEYGSVRRNSSFDTFDYDVNRLSLGAKAAF